MDHFEHQKVGPHSYIIAEVFPGARGGHGIGLFVGTQRACVVDTGWGVTGNLRNYVAQITDLPVICLLTHPHPDHAGASVQFDEIYMNPLDDSVAKWSLKREKRIKDATHGHEHDAAFLAEVEREFTDCSGFSYHPVNDGDQFDLGGIVVEAINIPGHTRGSMVFYCEEDRVLCTGDAIGQTVSLVCEGDEPPGSLKEYESALARLFAKIPPETKLITGHAITVQETQMIAALLTACDHAKNGRTPPAGTEIRMPKFIQNAKFPVSVAWEAGQVLIYSE